MADLQFLIADWPVISRHLDAALALPGSERDTWLDALHEPDEMKSALRRLLAEAVGAETDDFLDALPRMTLPPGADGSVGGDSKGRSEDAAAGLVVGPYRLIRELGVGGMGVVWLAERIDGGLKRQVAVKLPRLNWTQGLAERMNRERDILASLDHPHIARIHDAGLDSHGRPFLALEYVLGEPIDAYCKRLALPIAERLALILQVARAVAHAHARLVVHRDLKPANILVTAEGQVRLLDFGIAKLMEGELTRETALTMQSGRALTLDYASPEQIRGEPIGTASDVYSLGVVAYELLAEARPYRLKRQSAAALEEAIASVDVRPASAAATRETARRALRGDLDAVLNKAMKKAVAERYPNVEAFAQDIERHLARMPVHARPDAASYRARRFVARHAVAVGAGVAVALALISGTAVALWQASSARLEAARAEQVKNFALSIVSGADTESGAGRGTTAVELLQAARSRVAGDLTASDETAVELMTAVGAGLQSQGRPDDAAEVLAAARERATRTLGAGHPRTLTAATAYGTALLGLDRPKESIDVLKAVADEAARQRNVPARIAALRELSSAQLAAAESAAGLGSAREAVAAFTAARPALPPLEGFYVWAQLANALNVNRQPGLADAARHALAMAHAVYGERITDNVLSARLLLAKGLANDGQDADALAALEAVYRDTVRLLGPEHPRLEAVGNFLGSARADAGDLDGAVAAYRVALAAGERNPGGSGGNRGIGHFVLGRALAGQHRDKEALGHFEASSRLLAAAVGPTSVFTLRSRSAAGLALARLGRLDAAAREFDALDAAAWSGPEKAQHDGRLAQLRSLQGRHDEAVALARSSLAGLGASASMIARARAESVLGQILVDAGRGTEAAAPLQDAVRLYREKQTVVSAEQNDALLALGRVASSGPAEAVKKKD
ncbi:MAG: serine/threonine-protein kinase [Caldimonas sp.]